jgi:GFO/IDH/MocA oxidoreductase family protein
VQYELRRTLEAARGSKALTHLLAYSNTPDRHTLAAWINAGVIGNVREVHNWTNRPFWPQGWQEYYKSGPPVPDGFNWSLWQGPEPERPYHPNYTHAVYRGWYAYGAGCLGDMGLYSWWQPYRILGLGVPEWVEGRPNNEAFVDHNNVSDGGHVSLVGFPKASTVRWRHPATATRPSVDTFWYDGGMKPATPEELYADGEDLAGEGMLIVGDKGKILCDYRANKPRLIPASRQKAFEGQVVAKDFDTTSAEDEWVNALKNGTKSKGSFEELEALAEAVCLANISLRVPYKRLLWDSKKMEFTNSEAATKLVRRQEYRQGFEQLVE